MTQHVGRRDSDEIAMLRAQLEELKSAARKLADLEAQLRDAYERAYDVARHDMEVQLAKAETENERLRKALREAQQDMNEVGVETKS